METTTTTTEKNLQDDLKESAYRVWLAEVMLQQTTVAAVAGYFARFTERWPTVRDLAGPSFIFRPLGVHQAKGREEKVEIFELASGRA